MSNLAISIGRQYGSGGKEIGVYIAEKLGIKCYDSELITAVAKNSGLCSDVIAEHDERQQTGSFLYNLVMDTYSAGSYSSASFMDMPMNHKVFLAQFETIRDLAKKNSCVFVGRCADYALADEESCCSIFIHAPIDFRLERVKKDISLKDDKKIRDYINRTDKKRANYYNYYSNKKWGDANSYDLSIDSSLMPMEMNADAIIAYLKLRYPETIERLMSQQ